MTFHLRKIVLFYNILQFALIFWEIVQWQSFIFSEFFYTEMPALGGQVGLRMLFISIARVAEVPTVGPARPPRPGKAAIGLRTGNFPWAPRARYCVATPAPLLPFDCCSGARTGGCGASTAWGSPVPTGSGESRDPRLPDARAGSVGSTAQLLVHRMSGRRSEVSILVTFLLAQKVWLWGTWLVELTAWCRTADSLFISHLSVSDVHILDAGATAAVSIAPHSSGNGGQAPPDTGSAAARRRSH